MTLYTSKAYRFIHVLKAYRFIHVLKVYTAVFILNFFLAPLKCAGGCWSMTCFLHDTGYGYIHVHVVCVYLIILGSFDDDIM